MDLLALLLAIALVFLNGFFVATEFAIVKVRPTRIQELLAQHRPGAKAATQLTRNLDGYLSATQLGITLASLGLGWIGEPAFAALLNGPMQYWFGITDPEVLQKAALASAFLTITVLHIVIGELVPKSLAILRSESVALAVGYPMQLFYWLFWPGIATLNGLASVIVKRLGVTEGVHLEGHHSEEEIAIILGQARSAGLLSASRSDVLKRALSLPSKTARHLMVPRNEVIFFDLHHDNQENLARAMESGHTRFPLCKRELDDVIGIVDVRDILHRSLSGDDFDWQDLASPPTYFPEMMSAERLLSEFRSRRITVAVIVDEYGGASGIVTAADVVSPVMGDLEADDDEHDVVELPSGAFDADGLTPLEEVESAIKITISTDDMRTVAGFLMERLGRMPKMGDRVHEGGFTFQVLEVTGPKVGHVRIQRDSLGDTRPTAPSASPPKGK
jgi:CBS domain containing-hemolysin-like protein